MNLTLYIWRQARGEAEGRLVRYDAPDINPDMSFLEMLDVVNERLIHQGERPIEFEHDCREGICGSCGVVVDGIAHGPLPATATCQLHMRHFKDGDSLTIEPWRAKGFPVVQDLVVDRGAFDRIIQAGGFISASTGNAPEANSLPVGKDVAELAMDAAECIGCGACVAQCPNGAAHLFTAAKLAHLGLLPQGQPERYQRVVAMVERMEQEGFGSCSNFRECEAVCPKQVSSHWISRMNRDYLKAQLFLDRGPEKKRASGPG
ncbi:MAG TPA: succinate dehydrogenase/fumarate reductase iron-sulfur subunit [Thermoanaerobaculia bacterium]|nr:succinate dehydrogenase/fumarate reductase iron-sulfur subunit [Thermoanaerobaculia bacterium]